MMRCEKYLKGWVNEFKYNYRCRCTIGYPEDREVRLHNEEGLSRG
jgi:hypothetical protein